MSEAPAAPLPPPRPLVPRVRPVPRFFAGLVVSALGALSPSGLRRLARFIATVAWTLRIRRAVTLENLRHAFWDLPELERRRIGRGAYANMALAALESIAFCAKTHQETDAQVKLENWDLVERAREGGRGVLIATAHFGNWELLGDVMARRGYPVHVVARPLSGALNERIVRSRVEAGVTMIHPRGAVNTSVEALSKGAIVCMLIDQVLPATKGVFVPFFGRESCTTPALSVAAQKSGAPSFVAMAARVGDGLHLAIEGPVQMPDTGDPREDVRLHTAELTRLIELHIRKHPEQWLWLHRRWKVQPMAAQTAQR